MVSIIQDKEKLGEKSRIFQIFLTVLHKLGEIDGKRGYNGIILTSKCPYRINHHTLRSQILIT